MLSHYLGSISHTSRKTNIEKLCNFLQDKSKEWGGFSIVVRGVSGMVPGSIISHILDIPLIIVRKEQTAHTNNIVESEFEINKYIILDDFICSGYTVETIIQHIKQTNNEAQCIAFVGTVTDRGEYIRKENEKTIKKVTELSIPVYYPCCKAKS